MRNKWVSVTLLIVFSACLFLFGLGKMALTDPDEPFYAETAKEMLIRGEWLTPRIFGEPQFEKPVLYYWLVIISYKVFGVNEFAARFPSAILGILGVIGVYLLGGFLFSKRTAIYSSLVMATASEYMILARACVTDMLLCVLILYAFLFYLYAYSDEKRKVFYIFSSAALGLAVLTKGPIGLILPAFILGVYLVGRKDLKAVLRFPFVTGALTFLIVSVPWYYLMYRTYGPEFTDHFFGFQNITRFLHPEHKIGDVFYYYIPIVLGGFFPWSIFLPYGMWRLTRDDKGKYPQYLFLIVWILVFFIFFSVSRTKLPTYIFPLFPALGIIVGRFWDISIEKSGFNIWEKLSGLLYIISIPAGMIAFYIITIDKYPAMRMEAISTGVILSMCTVFSLIYLFRDRKELFFGSVVFMMSVFIACLVVFLSIPLGSYESSKYISKKLEGPAKKNEPIGAETDYQRGTAFYLNKEDIIDVHPHHVITKLLESDKRVWCVIKDKNHRQLYTDRDKPFHLPTYLVYKLGKKVIITNKLPDDGKYIKIRSINDPR